MPAFPSREWMEALRAQFLAHPDASDLSRSLDGTYAFVVEPAGPISQRHRYDLEIRPGDDAPVVQVLDEFAENPRVTLTANFTRWWQLLQGEVDPRMAVMLRRLKVSGDLWGVGRRIDSAKPLLEALRRVDTEWPE